MSSLSANSPWEIYGLMLEKSATYTVLFTGIVLTLLMVLAIFVPLSFSPGLRMFLREVIKGVRYSEGKLAYDGSPKSDETTVETDEKGNVKPPAGASQPSAPQQGVERDQFYWLFLIEAAWREAEQPLIKLEQYFKEVQKLSGQLPKSFIEATYLFARFQCGDPSALDALKGKAGPKREAYAFNGVLARYYEQIGENDEAQKYLEARLQHAPDSDRKISSAQSLATFLARTGRREAGLKLLNNQLSYPQPPNHQASLWEIHGHSLWRCQFRLAQASLL